MEYHGKLYGKLGKKYFDLEATSEDYDTLVQSLKESTEQCSRMQLEILRLESEVIKWKETNCFIK